MSTAYKGKWAFIIGGSEGIGLALAAEMLSRSTNVLIVSRSIEKLKTAKATLSHLTQGSVQCQTIACDATDMTALNIALKNVLENGIVPSFLFNCAGRALPDYFENISPEQLENSFRLNILTAWNPIQICLPYMKPYGGIIMNTSSVAGFVGVFGYTDYSITKFGLIGFSEALQSEVEQYNIKICVLCPPDTDTPGYEQENINKPKETLAISENAKLMLPEDVAKAAIREMEKGKFILLANTESKLTWWLKRLFPGLLRFIIQLDVRKSQKKS